LVDIRKSPYATVF